MGNHHWLRSQAAVLVATNFLAACLVGQIGDREGPAPGFDPGSGGSGGSAPGRGGLAGSRAGSSGAGAASGSLDNGSAGISPDAATRTDTGAVTLPEAGDAMSARPDAGGDSSPRAPDAGRDSGPIIIPVDAGPEAPGVFVAVGYGARRTRSIDDGRTWTDDVQLNANGGDDTMLLRTVTGAGGSFVAVGYEVITSPDGRTWSPPGPVLGQWFGAITYAKGIYVGVGGFGLRATSSNGVTWTNSPSLDTIASHAVGGLAYGEVLGGRFVSVNDNGLLSYSQDGRAWQFSSGTTLVANEVAYGNGVFVAVGNDAVGVSSDGGVTWSSGPRLAVVTLGLVFAQGHFTAIGSGHVFTSTDGAVWTDRTVSGIAGGAIAYGHGSYVLVSGTSRRRSSDGIAWDAAVTGGTNELVAVSFAATQ